MRAYFVPNECHSGITPHLLHAADSWFPGLDKYRGFFVCCDSGQGASTGVSLSFPGGDRSALGSTHDQLVSPELFRLTP